MELRKLGRTDIEISPIVMGTWQTGKQMWVGIEDRESERAIRSALHAGITTFDTAEVYGNGHSEVVLGRALGSDRTPPKCGGISAAPQPADLVQILPEVSSKTGDGNRDDIHHLCCFLARLAGFEPATYGFVVRHSIQLSYRRAGI